MKKSLTEKQLKEMIRNEAAALKLEQKFGEPEDVEKRAKETEETEADEYADTLGKHVDMLAALKIEESRLNRRLKTIGVERAKIMQTIKEGKVTK